MHIQNYSVGVLKYTHLTLHMYYILVTVVKWGNGLRLRAHVRPKGKVKVSYHTGFMIMNKDKHPLNLYGVVLNEIQQCALHSIVAVL